MLPKIELLRSLFGVSSGFLLELFDGIRNPAVSGERGVVSRELSRVTDKGTVILVTGRLLTRDEALIAAAIVADPVMRWLHDQVFQQLSVSAAWRGARATYPEATWPWKEAIPIELEGRWVERVDGSMRFIVSRIVSIGLPLSFSRVEVHHPGAEGTNENNNPASEIRTRLANAQRVILTTGRAASTSRYPMTVPSGTVILSTAGQIEVVAVPRGASARGNGGAIGEDRRDEAPFGTGGRQAGADTGVGAAMMKRGPVQAGEPEARSLGQALQLTWNALEAACAEGGWDIVALPERAAAQTGAPFGGLDLPREPLVAVVRAHDASVLVVDRGSPAGDEVSLGLLLPRDRSKSERALANSARKACRSVSGRWRSPMLDAPDFDVRSINRAVAVWENAEAFKGMLIRRLTSVLEMARL